MPCHQAGEMYLNDEEDDGVLGTVFAGITLEDAALAVGSRHWSCFSKGVLPCLTGGAWCKYLAG